jgi:ribosomal protein L36
MEKKDWKQGLSNGYNAQIVRRKNVVRVVPDKTKYNRKKEKQNNY